MPIVSGGGGGGGAPTGAAGGDLAGTYPNPTFDLTKAHSWSSAQTASALIASGLTGSTAASRYVGATASGAPSAGAHAVGDFVIDQTGKLFICTTAGTPGTWTQVGGSAAPTARQQIVGNAVAIANGATGTMTWDTSLGPTSLLDLTDPTKPSVVTAGVYAFSAIIIPDANLTTGGRYGIELTADLNNLAAQWEGESGTAFTSLLAPTTAAVLVWYLSPGDQMFLQVSNYDGVASRNFHLFANIQRVT